MLEVDTRVDDAEQDTSAVVFLVDARLQGVERNSQRVTGTGDLACLVGKETHVSSHVDATYTTKGCDVEKPFDGDAGGHQSILEFALNPDPQPFEDAYVLVVVQADEGRDVDTSVDSVGSCNHTPMVLAANYGMHLTLATWRFTLRGHLNWIKRNLTSQFLKEQLSGD